jgi:hypothetical protein
MLRAAACLALALATALTALGGEAGARGSNCRTSGKTVTRNSLVRIYKKTRYVVGDDQGEETVTRYEQRVWACRLATGQKLRLDDPCSPYDLANSDLSTCDEHWQIVALRGEYVGIYFSRNGSGLDNPNKLFWAHMDATPTRRSARTLQTPRYGSRPHLVRLYVSKRGGLAFSIQGTHVKGDKDNHSVIAKIAPFEPHVRPRYRELDSSPDVVASSLRAVEGRLTWLHGTRKRHGRWR